MANGYSDEEANAIAMALVNADKQTTKPDLMWEQELAAARASGCKNPELRVKLVRMFAFGQSDCEIVAAFEDIIAREVAVAREKALEVAANLIIARAKRDWREGSPTYKIHENNALAVLSLATQKEQTK